MASNLLLKGSPNPCLVWGERLHKTAGRNGVDAMFTSA